MPPHRNDCHDKEAKGFDLKNSRPANVPSDRQEAILRHFPSPLNSPHGAHSFLLGENANKIEFFEKVFFQNVLHKVVYRVIDTEYSIWT